MTRRPSGGPTQSSAPAQALGRPRKNDKLPRPKRAPEPKSLVGRSVLVVEDDAASRKLEVVVLTDAGALVTAAESAEEAAIALSRQKPDVIILDLVLPRMGGLVFAELLKSDPANRDIVTIAVTSLNGPDAERMALRAGCAAYLRKPIDTDTFAATVASHLGGKS